MPKLLILPLEEEVDLKEGETVLRALQRKGIEIESACNGEGVCGTCGVWVKNPEDVPETPHQNITKEQAQKGLRLACQMVPEEDITIRLPSDYSRDAKRIREAQRILVGDKISWFRVAPAVKVYEEKGTWWIHYDGEPRPEVLQNWPGNRAVPKGLAVDLGTTTLVVTLLSLDTGRELATASRLNPQIRFGHDVLSRIKEGSSAEGLSALAAAARGALNQLLVQVCRNSGSDPMEVLDAVVGGNTTMLQLAAEIDPAPLGHVPFTVGIRGGRSYPAGDFGLKVNPRGRVYVPPVAHAFVGSDISAGLLVSGGFFDDFETMLFMDVGTNGEMALSAGSKRVMTSTAAGPAFEGMGLSHGMRAAVGAVEAVEVKEEGDTLRIYTIGNAPAKGICGSGMIDLLASLLRLGVVDGSGKMMRPGEANGLSEELEGCLEELDGKAAFRLGPGVYFTQEDVRQVQLAKAAIRAAMDLLLEETEVAAFDLDRIVIAGGFGFSLRPESLETIGLIPRGTSGKVSFAGNTSRIGSAWLVMDISYRRFLEDRMGEVRHVAIAERPDFMDLYVESMSF